MSAQEIRFDAYAQVQMILASAVYMGMDKATLRFVELAILGLKAEEIMKGQR
jgi:hypothetical protein